MNRPEPAWMHNRAEMLEMHDLDDWVGVVGARRARLLGARHYGVRSIPRSAILRGDWDRGDAVRRHLPTLKGEGRHG